MNKWECDLLIVIDIGKLVVCKIWSCVIKVKQVYAKQIDDPTTPCLKCQQSKSVYKI